MIFAKDFWADICKRFLSRWYLQKIFEQMIFTKVFWAVHICKRFLSRLYSQKIFEQMIFVKDSWADDIWKGFWADDICKRFLSRCYLQKIFEHMIWKRFLPVDICKNIFLADDICNKKWEDDVCKIFLSSWYLQKKKLPRLLCKRWWAACSGAKKRSDQCKGRSSHQIIVFLISHNAQDPILYSACTALHNNV